jgi:hypothetical protein
MHTFNLLCLNKVIQVHHSHTPFILSKTIYKKNQNKTKQNTSKSNKLKNYVVTIELILAGDENLTPNQNIEIFSVVYSFIRSTQRFN